MFPQKFVLKTIVAQAIRYDPVEEDLAITLNRRLSTQAASSLLVRISEDSHRGKAPSVLAVKSVSERELRVPAPLPLRRGLAEGVIVEVWHRE